MTGKIKFEEAMKARIEKMHRPVVDSAEGLVMLGHSKKQQTVN